MLLLKRIYTLFTGRVLLHPKPPFIINVHLRQSVISHFLRYLLYWSHSLLFSYPFSHHVYLTFDYLHSLSVTVSPVPRLQRVAYCLSSLPTKSCRFQFVAMTFVRIIPSWSLKLVHILSHATIITLIVSHSWKFFGNYF